VREAERAPARDAERLAETYAIGTERRESRSRSGASGRGARARGVRIFSRRFLVPC